MAVVGWPNRWSATFAATLEKQFEYAKHEAHYLLRMVSAPDVRHLLSQRLARMCACVPSGARAACYDERVKAALIKIWKVMDYIYGKRMQPALAEMVEVLERHTCIAIWLVSLVRLGSTAITALKIRCV